MIDHTIALSASKSSHPAFLLPPSVCWHPSVWVLISALPQENMAPRGSGPCLAPGTCTPGMESDATGDAPGTWTELVRCHPTPTPGLFSEV